MYNHIEEKCCDCYFWIHSDFEDVNALTGVRSVTIGMCIRFPTKVQKLRDEGCGEFKPKKKGPQILREEKKDETNS